MKAFIDFFFVQDVNGEMVSIIHPFVAIFIGVGLLVAALLSRESTP